MFYYAAQISSRNEQKFSQLADELVRMQDIAGRTIYLQRKMIIRRQGKTMSELQPVFPGYVFFEFQERMGDCLCGMISRLKYFQRFLPNNLEREEISGRDLALLGHFLEFGSVMDVSKASFDENNRIRIASGPLHGLEGNIIKVDRRKRRVKIRFTFQDSDMTVDLSYEEIEKIPEK